MTALYCGDTEIRFPRKAKVCQRAKSAAVLAARPALHYPFAELHLAHGFACQRRRVAEGHLHHTAAAQASDDFVHLGTPAARSWALTAGPVSVEGATVRTKRQIGYLVGIHHEPFHSEHDRHVAGAAGEIQDVIAHEHKLGSGHVNDLPVAGGQQELPREGGDARDQSDGVVYA